MIYLHLHIQGQNTRVLLNVAHVSGVVEGSEKFPGTTIYTTAAPDGCFTVEESYDTVMSLLPAPL